MHVPDNAIADQCTVSGLTYTTDQRPIIKFSDGTPNLAADLVIGADGVKSVVKRCVTGDGETDEYPAVFESVKPTFSTFRNCF